FSRDWSSDVCSSDLRHRAVHLFLDVQCCCNLFEVLVEFMFVVCNEALITCYIIILAKLIFKKVVLVVLCGRLVVKHVQKALYIRSEERRVGKECRSR